MKMPWWFGLLLVVPAVSAAPQPADFALQLPIAAPAEAGLLRMTLPAAAYRAARRADLGDVRIFNAAGDPVPMARLPARGEAPPRRTVRPLVALPVPTAGVPESVVVSRSNGDGSLRVEVDAGAPARQGGYLLEVKDFDAPIDELELAWAAAAAFEAAVRVRASDDLKTWRTVARNTPVLAIGAGEARIVQDRVALPAVKARYLRVDWDGAAPAVTLQQATLVSLHPDGPPAREWLMLDGEADGRRIDYVSPGLFPVDAVRLVPTGDNDVVSAAVSSRPAVSARWQWRARTVGYRLQQAGATEEGAPTAIAPTRDPLWQVMADSPPGASAQPRLALGWVPETVVFVARGAGPYTLAVGHAAMPPAWLAPAQVVPGHGTPAAAEPAEAQVLASALPVGDVARDSAAWHSGRLWLLWAVLLAAVAVLGVMARGLWRELRAGEDET
ncbi:MAG: DUF3999 family protein [Proteobacteria bacterium]|nr:MAG: DUF3999 family protein [Pseudomonadota bacterium]